MEPLEILLYEIPGDQLAGDVVLLADEMVEDPRCRLVAVGRDGAGTVLVTVWDPGFAAEVEEGLLARNGAAAIRRLEMPAGLGHW
jgi:hypothetical protein